MEKSLSEIIGYLVDKINLYGCRVTIPYQTPSPLQVVFDGDFSCAGYIPTYPPVLHFGGFPGHISISNLTKVSQLDRNRFVVNFGADSQFCDMMVRINE